MNIRKTFYTYRNGVVADALKKAGDPHVMIFGLQLPQLGAIAKELLALLEDDGRSELAEHDRISLARQLWSERDCRESRLLAAYLFDPARLSLDEASGLLRECQTHEEVDILVFRALRHTPHLALLLEKEEDAYRREALSRFID